ncbi:MAG: hypothetical protein AAF806_19295 [Bacteroidota bacterium]
MSVEKIYKNELNIPISIHHNFCENYDLETGGSLSQYSKNFQLKIDDSLSETFNDLSKRYKDHKLNRLVGKTALEINATIIRGAFEFVSVPSKSTGVGYFLTKGLKKGMDILLDQTMELYDQQSREETERIIGKHLQILRDKDNVNFEEVSGMNQAEAFQMLFQSDKGIFDNSITEIEDEDKPNMIFHMTKLIESKFTNALVLNELADRAQQQEIDELKGSVKKLQTLGRTLIHFQKENVKKINRITSNLAVVRDNVRQLRNDVNINKEDISILKDFMFNNLDVGQQIKAIESGMRGDPNLPENKKLKLQLEAFKAKEDLSKEISGYVNSAQSIMTIANNIGDKLGIDPEFLETANELVNAGSTIANAYLNYTSGNVLDAAAQISSLFGSKKDAAAERHKQVMRRLQIIDTKLNHVLENQQSILENQQTMINLQLDTLKTIGKLAEDLDEKHAREIQKLDNIHKDLIYNREILMGQAFKDIKNLNRFVRYFSSYKLINGKLVNHKDRKVHWRSYSRAFFDAFDELLNEIDPENLGTYLKLQSYVTEGEYKKLNLALNSFNQFIKFIEKYHSNKRNQIILSSLLATSSLSSFQTKRNLLKDSPQEMYNWKSIRKLVSVYHLEAICRMLIRSHEFFILQKNRFELYEIAELYQEEYYNISGLNILKDIEKIINISIIQENILSGDIMLELVYQTLYESFGEDPTTSDKYDAVIEVLKNELFRKNFIKYLLRTELQKTGNNSFQYNMALNITDIENPLLRNMFSHSKLSTGLTYITKNEKFEQGWYIALPLDKTGDPMHLKLMNYKEYDNGKLSYRYEMEKLHILKNEIIDVLLDYESIELIEEDKELINHLMSN